MDSDSLSTRNVARIFFTVVVLSAALYACYLLRDTIKLLFISLFLAVALGPLVDLFQRTRMPRSLSILCVYLSLGVVIFGVGMLIVPPVVTQVDDLARDIPSYLTQARENETLREFDNKYDVTVKLKEQAQQLPEKLGSAAGTLQSVTVGAFSAAVQLITVLTITFFLLSDGKRLLGFFYRLMGKERKQRYEIVLNDIYRSVAGYVVGKLLMSLIAGVVTYISLLILDVPFAVPLSVFMAFVSLIPMVGATIGAVAIALVTLFNDFPSSTIIWLIISVVYQQVENSLLQPAIFKRTVDVHPLIVIVSILIGASLLGVLGALVAIPVAAAIQIVVRDWWRFRQGPTGNEPSELDPPSGDPPSAVPPLGPGNGGAEHAPQVS